MWAIQPKADGAVLADFAQEIVAKTLKEMKAGIEERYAESFGVDPIRTIEKAEICLEHMRKSISRGTGSDSFEDEIYMDALRKAYDEIVEACIAINQVFKMADN